MIPTVACPPVRATGVYEKDGDARARTSRLSESRDQEQESQRGQPGPASYVVASLHVNVLTFGLAAESMSAVTHTRARRGKKGSATMKY